MYTHTHTHTQSHTSTRPFPNGSSIMCPISSVTNSTQLTKATIPIYTSSVTNSTLYNSSVTNSTQLTEATIPGTRTGDVSLTTAKGSVRVKMLKKRDVCLEYDSGSGEHLHKFAYFSLVY